MTEDEEITHDWFLSDKTWEEYYEGDDDGKSE
jgi:hypothetical protein